MITMPEYVRYIYNWADSMHCYQGHSHAVSDSCKFVHVYSHVINYGQSTEDWKTIPTFSSYCTVQSISRWIHPHCQIYRVNCMPWTVLKGVNFSSSASKMRKPCIIGSPGLFCCHYGIYAVFMLWLFSNLLLLGLATVILINVLQLCGFCVFSIPLAESKECFICVCRFKLCMPGVESSSLLSVM